MRDGAEGVPLAGLAVTRAFNKRTEKELSSNVVAARSALERMKGLLGRSGLHPGESLLIRPCRAIHTIGMSFPIDVLFLDAAGTVVGLRERMRPNRLTGIIFKARAVLELPAGTLSATDTMLGDTITFPEPLPRDR